MKRAHYFLRKVQLVWEMAALGHAHGLELAVQARKIGL